MKVTREPLSSVAFIFAGYVFVIIVGITYLSSMDQYPSVFVRFNDSSATVNTPPPTVNPDCVVQAVPDFGTAPLSTTISITSENTAISHNKHKFIFGDGTQTGNISNSTQTHAYQNGGNYGITVELRECSFLRCTVVGSCSTSLSVINTSTPTPTPSVSLTPTPAPTQPGSCGLIAVPSSGARPLNTSFSIQENNLNSHNRHYIRYTNTQDWIRLSNNDPVSIPSYIYDTDGNYTATFEARSCGLFSCRVVASCSTAITVSFSTPPSSGGLSARDDFNTSCADCWPGWTQLDSPNNGVQDPRVINGLGFSFINGYAYYDYYLQNKRHMRFDASLPDIKGIHAGFKFSSAGGGAFRLNPRNGDGYCLQEGNVNGYTSDELVVFTMQENGATDLTSSWYGAFIGDYRILDPTYIPDEGGEDGSPYIAVGIIQRRGDTGEIILHNVQAISQLPRFQPVDVDFSVDGGILTADFSFPNLPSRGTTSVMGAVDPLQPVISGGKAGLIHIATETSVNGYVCSSVSQREIATEFFEIRQSP